MRQIKFRAWDDKKKIMIPNITLAGLKNWEGVNFYEWMQFTGLHDKNGKEIYEGDIIQIWQYTGNHCLKMSKGPKRIVNWNCENARYTGFPICAKRTNTEYEIIGNIYENPELLTP